LQGSGQPPPGPHALPAVEVLLGCPPCAHLLREALLLLLPLIDALAFVRIQAGYLAVVPAGRARSEVRFHDSTMPPTRRCLADVKRIIRARRHTCQSGLPDFLPLPAVLKPSAPPPLPAMARAPSLHSPTTGQRLGNTSGSSIVCTSLTYHDNYRCVVMSITAAAC
jgi:hypothetical protein